MGSSSSYAELEVMEIPPQLADRTSKLKAKGKQKEVAFHEIIDLDADEDCDDVVILEGNAESRKRARDSMGISLGPSTSSPKKVASNKKRKGIAVEPGNSFMGFNPGSNNFFDLDDYVYDDDCWELPSTFNTQFGNGSSSSPQLAINTASPLGIDTTNSDGHKSIMKNHMNDILPGQDATVNGPTSSNSKSIETVSSVAKVLDGDVKKRSKSSKKGETSSSKAKLVNADVEKMSKSSKKGETRTRKAKLVDGEVQKKYESFKKFDTVVDHSGHHYAKQKSAMNQPPKNWAKKIQEEWKILEKHLPDTIFVRAYESRMDLLRAVIIGAEGTPYHDGLFFFDVCFPSNYPNSPPLVHYHSGGLHINPNLYPCGKVCLSLLNTWRGDDQTQNWIPGTSTMLQVLVSIQGLILNMKPYFNEPGYAHSSGSAHGEKASLQYNENTLILSLKTMVYTMNKPPKHFEDLVIGHFQHRARDILMACKAYTKGVQVGCVVKGGVQDVDEGNSKCSPKFYQKKKCSPKLKNDVRSYIKTLVASFKKIGAKEAEEFLFLSDTKSS